MSQTTSSISLGVYETRPYECDGGFSASGLVLVTVAGVVVAMLCGVVASAVGQIFYSVLLYPALIGAAIMETGRLADLASLPHAPKHEAAISVYACPYCGVQSDAVLQVDSVTRDGRSREKLQETRIVYPGEAVEQLAYSLFSMSDRPLCDDVDPAVVPKVLAAANGYSIAAPRAAEPSRPVPPQA